jgi:hypothetical protein
VNVGDTALLAWGTIALFLPGAAVLVALRRLSLVTALAGAPVVTIGLLYVAGLVGGVTGLDFGVLLVVAVSALVGVGAFVLGRGRPLAGVLVRPRPSGSHWVGAAATLVATVLATWTWTDGLGSLGTVPQEHDTIIHGELVARVMLTGEGAPWQSFPADLLSGEPASFYPNGFHLFAAVVGGFGADPVTALNAAMVVLFAVALPLGVAALGMRLAPRRLARPPSPSPRGPSSCCW